MRPLRLLNLFLVIAVLTSALAPLAYAAGDTGSQSTSSQIAFQEEPESQPPQENAGAGAAIAMLIVGFILLLVFVIAVIGAVGLGVVGLGVASSQSED